MIERFDRYAQEIPELIQILKIRLLNEPLTEPEPRRIATMVASELQWRGALLNSPMRQALDEMERDPENFEAAYNAYAAAVLLSPFKGRSV